MAQARLLRSLSHLVAAILLADEKAPLESRSLGVVHFDRKDFLPAGAAAK